MNYIWSGIMIFSFLFAAANGRMTETVTALFSGTGAAVNSVAAMAGAFCFWSGVLKIAEKSGFSKLISKLINPMVSVLFPSLKKDSAARGYITMNMVANLLGMGNAATPAGVNAMQELDKLNSGAEHISDDMCMLVVINTASLQIIPTTILSLRAASANPAEVIVPIWIASVAAFISAVCAARFVNRRCKRV